MESDGIGGYGDSYDEIVSGRGHAAVNDVAMRLYDYDASSVAFKFGVVAYTMYGVPPAGGDVDAGDTEEIATAPGPDPAAPAHILCWEWNPALGSNPTRGPPDDRHGRPHRAPGRALRSVYRGGHVRVAARSF